MTTTTKARVIKQTPMMFRPELVKAIRDRRKTQTRRLVKNLINEFNHCDRMRVIETGEHFFRFSLSVDGVTTTQDVDCPYKIGDRLYVQEGAIKIGHERTGRNGQYLWPKISDTFTEEDARDWFDKSCLYTLDLRHDDPMYDEPHGTLNKMFMPRWASRITLEITDVRVQRLNDISDADAQEEGVGGMRDMRFAAALGNLHSTGHRLNFMDLWNEINGPGAWKLNPWVWALTFKRVAADP